MKLLTYLLCISLSVTALGQDWEFEAPNYKKIEKAIKKKRSNLFYPKLMDRYLLGDTTMSLEERRYLYYGYTFQLGYSPYGESDYEDSLSLVLEKEKIDSSDYLTIISHTNKILEEFPFNMYALNYQLLALEFLADQTTFEIRLNQYLIILDAMVSSGTGVSKEEAFYVINTSHEYELLAVLGFEFGGTQSLTDHYDYLTIAPNEFGLEGMYFDVSPCLKSLSLMFD